MSAKLMTIPDQSDFMLTGRRNFARKLHASVAFEVWVERYA